MSTQDKQRANAALEKLRTYLRNDPRGGPLIADVCRFVGELRRERSALLTQVRELSQTCEKLKHSRDALENECCTLRTERLQLNEDVMRKANRCIQLTHQCEQAQAEIDTILDRKFADAPQCQGELRELNRLARSFARRFSGKVPRYRTLPIPGDSKALCFNIREWVKTYADDEFLQIGILVALMCMLPQREAAVIFERQDERPRKKSDVITSEALLGWFMKQGWIAEPTEAEKRDANKLLCLDVISTLNNRISWKS